jgi:hypothetical protein
VIYPLVIGYAAYSLIYETHQNWYSWILSSLVGFIYTFGFIMMTPQLFINYKMKSVAHMPWRTFLYKALNTFIDDLFAFIIRMPTLHRLACFRDGKTTRVFRRDRKSNWEGISCILVSTHIISYWLSIPPLSRYNFPDLSLSAMDLSDRQDESQ